jgi:putative two-component system response regulator
MQGAHILAVDDDRHVRDLIRLLLEDAGHRCTGAASAKDAWTCLREHDFELVLCDVRMPGQSGLELARHIIAEHPDTAVVMVTGLDDAGIGQAALAFGAYGYVVKPFRSTELLMNVENALRRRAAAISSRRERNTLERALEERAAELKEAVLSMQEAARAQHLSGEDTVRRLSRAIEFRSRETWQHIERMGELSSLLARRLGFDSDYVQMIGLAAPMHDVGKVAVPDAILSKPGPLSEAEWGYMREHTIVGDRILSAAPALEDAAKLVRSSHERYDGTGYPDRLRGEEIPLGARIVAVCDAFHAMTSQRPYRPALSMPEALDELHRCSGAQFDPKVVRAFTVVVTGTRGAVGVGQADRPDELGEWAATVPAPADVSR